MNPEVRTTLMPEPVLVAVAHGSADPRASDTIDKLMAMVAQRAAGLDLRTAYLGHDLPSLPQVMTTIDPRRAVTVLPLLLMEAYHSKTDIPRILARFRDRTCVMALRSDRTPFCSGCWSVASSR